MNIRLVVGLVCSGIGLLLYVVGIATTAWLSTAGVENGLWQACVLVPVRVCAWWDISTLGAFDHACRFFALVGALLLIPGVVLGILYAVKQGFTDKVYMKKTAGGLIIAAGACGFLTAAIYTGYFQANTVGAVPYGYSFYLTWVQTFFTVGGGAVCLTA